MTGGSRSYTHGRLCIMCALKGICANEPPTAGVLGIIALQENLGQMVCPPKLTIKKTK